MARILIVDDEENIRSSLKNALERRDHEVVTAADYAEGARFAGAGFDIIFLDVMLPDGNGIDLLEDVHARTPDQPVVMISGKADIDMAVKAIKSGAVDFIEKPLSLDRVMITIENITRTSRLQNERERLSSLVYGDFIGDSPSIKKLKEDITASAPKTGRFLIYGENGTGKELVAHLIHRRSAKSNGPFVAVNCAALPSELIESELFGHAKGAFTGAAKERKGYFLEADSGTIFLDEISEMPLTAQAKILRAIETREISPVGKEKSFKVDCNIIAATNKDLQKMVKDGSFREDLFYRLNVVNFKIPPLRKRPEDIPALAAYFLARFAAGSGNKAKNLSEDAVAVLQDYKFPGNVRELKNLMERINIYIEKDIVSAADIRPLMPQFDTARQISLKDAVTSFEKEFIQSAIDRNDGNVTKAARELGIERSHLYKKLKKP